MAFLSAVLFGCLRWLLFGSCHHIELGPVDDTTEYMLLFFKLVISVIYV